MCSYRLEGTIFAVCDLLPSALTELAGVIVSSQKKIMTVVTMCSYTKLNMKYEMIHDCPVIITDVWVEQVDIVAIAK